jgi:hypothetical protein
MRQSNLSCGCAAFALIALLLATSAFFRSGPLKPDKPFYLDRFDNREREHFNTKSECEERREEYRVLQIPCSQCEKEQP